MVEKAKSAQKPSKKSKQKPRHIRLYELSTKTQILGAQRRKEIEKEHLERSPPPPQASCKSTAPSTMRKHENNTYKNRGGITNKNIRAQ